MSPLRSVVVLHLAEITGPAKSMLPRVGWLAEQGAAEVLVPGEGEAEHAYSQIARVTRLEYSALTVPRSPRAALSAARRMWREVRLFRRHLRAARPDLVVVVTSVLPAALVAAWLERIPAITYVGEALGSRAERGRLRTLTGRATARLTASLSRAVVCCSDFAAGAFPSSSRAVVTTIPPGIALDGAGDAEAFRRAHALAGESPLIAVVGNLSEGRGQDLAIRALPEIRRRLPGAGLVLVGAPHPRAVDEEYAAGLRRLAAELGVTDAVTFTGFVRRVQDAYAAADVVVNPARHNEAFGRAPLEALASGTPVVATAVGAVPEVLGEGRDGILVPSDDVDALAAAVVRVVEDRELAEGLVQRAATETLPRFTEQAGVERFADVVRDVTAPPEQPARPSRGERLLTWSFACAAAVLAAMLLVWPLAAVLGAAVLFVLLLALRRPWPAFLVALGLLGFEGSVKILLLNYGSPSGESAAFAALAIDAALFGTALLLLHRLGLGPLRETWNAATRAERIVLGAGIAWIALSIVYVPVSGEPVRGAMGFRLTQAYVLMALVGVVAFWSRDHLAERVRALLIPLLVIGGYATLRVVTGPTATERAYARGQGTVSDVGDVFRAVGSFSSSVGMLSWIVPATVFALGLALLAPRHRLLAGVAAVCAFVAVSASFGRGSIVALAAGLGAIAVLTLASSSVPRRHKRRLLVAAGVVALVGGGVTAAAATISPRVQERAGGIVDPLGDESMQIRFDTWERHLERVPDHPLGRGLGTVGDASGDTREELVTTDNGYLKVLVEQGVPGLALFLVFVVGICIVIGLRLRRADAVRAAVGIAALSGAIALLAMTTIGEYTEQPGKAVMWLLLGIALAQAFAPARETPR